tara:strand:+ start:5714 stop:6283 length:570 start_codon:yes stop_codon:yes gene_type:complete
MDFSLYGLLECLQLKNLSPKALAAENVSNTLIILYAISYMLNRKAVFITAFLLIEMLGLLSPVDYITGCSVGCVTYWPYYFMCAIGYSFCYWVIFNQTGSLKKCSGYVMLVLLELTITYNEWAQPTIETFLYTHYEYIIMAIHIYIIITVIEWGRTINATNDIFNSIGSIFSSSYSLSFFWYNIRKNLI